MVQPSEIIDFADRIAARFRPERIILFGSYAYGTPTEDSDVDLLVVMRLRRLRTDPRDKAVEIRTAAGSSFPLDLLVRTPATIRQRLEWNDFFLQEVVRKGIILYEASDPRVGGKGRRRLRRRQHARALAQAGALRRRMLPLSAVR
jgi:predicted nucleotidyltransferase